MIIMPLSQCIFFHPYIRESGRYTLHWLRRFFSHTVYVLLYLLVDAYSNQSYASSSSTTTTSSLCYAMLCCVCFLVICMFFLPVESFGSFFFSPPPSREREASLYFLCVFMFFSCFRCGCYLFISFFVIFYSCQLTNVFK